MSKKPRKDPADRDQWTERDVSGSRYLELCAADRRGELRLARWGVGSSNGLWHVLYFTSQRKSDGAEPAGRVATPAAEDRLFNAGSTPGAGSSFRPLRFDGARPWNSEKISSCSNETASFGVGKGPVWVTRLQEGAGKRVNQTHR